MWATHASADPLSSALILPRILRNPLRVRVDRLRVDIDGVAAHEADERDARLVGELASMADFKVIVRNNGPYRLEGEGITICDQEGRVYGLAGRTVVSLCRCG